MLIHEHNQQANTFASPSSYQQKPPGYKSGAFPREHLITGETIFWEGKPALIAYLLSPIIWIIFSLIITAIFPPLGIIFLFFGILGVIAGYIRWMMTSFAITNRRVLSQYGVFSKKFADCPHDKIQNSVVIKPFLQTLLGYGELMFATAGFRGGISSGSAYKMMANGGGVYWNGLPRPAEVKRFAEEIMESSKSEAKLKEYEMMANVLNQGKKAEYQMMADTMGTKQNVQTKQSVEERLANVTQLRQDNKITQQEYEEMRRKILADL